MNKRYNIYHKKLIQLNDGEKFCPKCDGKGKVKQNGYYLTTNIVLTCDKCLGDGKIDWIEKATGKQNRLLRQFR